MKRVALIALWAAAAAIASAQEPIALTVYESRTIDAAGATAAWALDANIVDAAAENGRITLSGRNPGRTRVMVLSTSGTDALEVVVASRAAARKAAAAARNDHAVAEARYTSATREIQSSVSMTRQDGGNRTEVQLRTAHHATAPAGDRAKTSIPSATIRFFTGSREITLLDREVDHSPLTLSSTPLRGLHYVDDHWRLHAGFTTFAAYRSFFIPVDREFVGGAAYAFRPSQRSSVTPSIFAYRGRGSVVSLLYDYDDATGTVAQAELGYSDGFGGAVRLTKNGARDLVRADVRYRPQAFAGTTSGTPPGLVGDALWTHSYGRGSTTSTTATISDVAGIRAIGASADVDHRLNDVLSLTGGASWGSFGATRSLMVPAGFRADFSRGGFGALYRHARSSVNSGGHGGRIFGRMSVGRVHLNAWADRQENAPTLGLILRDAPELALALEELGLTASSPADIARALREHAALAELGFIDGITIDLSPVRTQYGLEFAWLGDSASRQQLRLRVMHSESEGVTTGTATTIATLAWARRLTPATDLYASYSYWRTDRSDGPARVEPFVEAGIRQQFDSLPSFGGGTIAGAVFADEDLDGRSDGGPVAAEVELDGTKVVRTNADGTFAFSNVSRGAHRVVARVPDRPDAYFTTPSRVEAAPGDRIAFGVASTPARLLGRVTSDAAEGIAGVRVLLSRGTTRLAATSDSSGAFAFAAAPGEWQLSIVIDSVAAGYSLRGTETRTVTLNRSQPLHVSQQLQANRSIAGSGAPAHAIIELPDHGRNVRADGEGRFALRSLPPGEITLVAGNVRRQVVIPNGPARIDVSLAPPPAAAEPVRIVTSGERHDAMQWVVQLGAYRVRANAVATVARAKRQGVEATIDTSGALSIVRAGPFASRMVADDAAITLTRAGLETIVVSAN